MDHGNAMTQPEPHATDPKPLLWKKRTVGVALLLAVGLLVLYGPSLRAYAKLMRNPLTIAEDANQHVWPYLRYMENGPMGLDPDADYFERCHPVGYRALLHGLARVSDPRDSSKALLYPLLAIAVVGISISAYRLGGFGAVLFAVALLLSSAAFIPRMAGGIPRSFAIPCLAVGLAGLVTGRPWIVAFATLLAAATYPAVSVALGLSLAWLLLGPSSERGPSAGWSLRRRMAYLAGTGILTVLLALPTAISAARFGPSIRPSDLAAYPEAQPGGRLGTRDLVTFDCSIGELLRNSADLVTRVSGGHWLPGSDRAYGRAVQKWAWLIALMPALVLVARGWRDPAVRRLFILPVSAWIAFRLSCAVSPALFLPERHIAYAVPVVVLLAMAGGLARIVRGRHPIARTLQVAAPLIALILLTGPIGRKAGITRTHSFAPSASGRMVELPRNAIIAGPPMTMDQVGYLAGRRTYLTREQALPYHAQHVQGTRDRLQKQGKLWLETELAPFREQAQTLGITHILLQTEHRRVEEWMPAYMPFVAEYRSNAAALRSRGVEPIVLQPGALAVEAEGEGWTLLRVR